MTLTVFLAVLLAAALHASWNALVKGGQDMWVNMAGVVLGHTPMALIVLFFVPMPAPESYPYILAGIALHFGYQLFLLQSYRIGDLTQVYPIARGIAPLIVAGVSTMALGVVLERMELLAIGLIAAGIMSLSLVRKSDGTRNHVAALLAAITGCFIASYSLNDGMGARVAGTALGFYGWVALGNAIVFALYLSVTRRQVFAQLGRGQGLRVMVIGGTASYLAYAIVTWSFTQAPIALVTALRETSIIFALLIGVGFLKERLDLFKVASTFLTICGAALLRLARP
ncbi:drug/metabolite transporter (DMT)-like permease [Rubricella aquisinus]|uniref:Drug/metabolite transporter (DMT)-like permease n=1 Tax=Rubricella aquisinus TaxID=2028108 RepID=A0A840WX24_9RHOB|nr:DMT family transporter [Rubricella aquisinus]MBB5515730.1 drug/metabolite transporter (DMT)-like permease [Rubricella aquisinus]